MVVGRRRLGAEVGPELNAGGLGPGISTYHRTFDQHPLHHRPPRVWWFLRSRIRLAHLLAGDNGNLQGENQHLQVNSL